MEKKVKNRKFRTKPDTERTRNYLDTLPKMHVVACWAKYGVASYPFTGKYINQDGISIPIVWRWQDNYPYTDRWAEMPITYTGGVVKIWTQELRLAKSIAEMYNSKKLPSEAHHLDGNHFNNTLES